MICCGDGFNDISMIEYAGLGVAMENAQDLVKQASDYITSSNDNNGILQVIQQFFLNKNSKVYIFRKVVYCSNRNSINFRF